MEYVKLGKLVELKQGLAINSHTNHLVCNHETSLALLRIADMPTKRKVVFMDENTPDRYIAVEDDIIYTRTGQVGLVFTGQKGVVHNNCFRVIPIDEKTLSKKYLFWALSLPEIYYLANIYAAGAAQPDLPHTSFKKIKIPICSLAEQNQIATTLSAYDNLIENNNRRIRLLEQMVENLYKEWFVRFRFPGCENVQMENGLPQGWQVMSICKSPYFKFSKSPIKNFPGLKQYFATADVEKTNLNSDGEIIDFDNKPSRAQISPSRNSIWFARMINSYKILSFNKCNEELRVKSILSSGFVGFETTPEYYGFMYALISSKDFDKVKDMYCTGSTQMSITNSSIEKIKHISPTVDVVKRFSLLVTPIIEETTLLRHNIKSLKKQRDLLLPRLMSGKLEVNA